MSQQDQAPDRISVTTRFVICDGAELARFWARIGSDDSETLLWVPREKESRARPPAFRSLPGGVNPRSLGKLDIKANDFFAVVSEDPSFVRSTVNAISEISPDAPLLVMSDRMNQEDFVNHNCIRMTGLRTQLRDDVHNEFRHLANLQKAVCLKSLLVEREKIGILLQPDPDPDGIACGYALRALLGRKAPTAPLISFGQVQRPENQAMVSAIGIEIRTVLPEELDEFDGLALVDVQPTVFGENPPARVLSVDLVIDHHPERTGYEALVRDIRPNYGATATIFTEYLRATNVDMNARLATALLYGIKSDTQLLGRDTSSADMDAFAYLHSCYSPALLRRIERPALPADGLRRLGRALSKTKLQDNIHLLVLGRVREDVIPQVAELGLQAEGAEWSVAAGIVGQNLVFSVRNVGHVRAAGEVVRAVVEGLGVGGGHRTMAKGIVPLKAFREVYKRTNQGTIRKALIKAFKSAIKGEESDASLALG